MSLTWKTSNYTFRLKIEKVPIFFSVFTNSVFQSGQKFNVNSELFVIGKIENQILGDFSKNDLKKFYVHLQQI